MTPQQLIDACRATNQPLPSGRKIAEVVERLVNERNDLAEFVVSYGTIASRESTGRTWCNECNMYIIPEDPKRPNDGHKAECSVALAERILKGAS